MASWSSSSIAAAISSMRTKHRMVAGRSKALLEKPSTTTSTKWNWNKFGPNASNLFKAMEDILNVSAGIGYIGQLWNRFWLFIFPQSRASLQPSRLPGRLLPRISEVNSRSEQPRTSRGNRNESSTCSPPVITFSKTPAGWKSWTGNPLLWKGRI